MKKILATITLTLAASTVYADPYIDFQATILSTTLFTCQMALRNGSSGIDFCAKEKESQLEKFKPNFGKASANPKVKLMFAQWMTAMDTAGTRVGATEEAKFNTLVNELKLE